MKNHQVIFYIMLFFSASFFSCQTEKRELSSLGGLEIFLPPCELPVVKACMTQCEIIFSARNLAIQQEIQSGSSLSNFSLSVCAGQFSPIYSCFLSNLGNACQVLSDIINTQNFKRVLENPVCQCSTVFS